MKDLSIRLQSRQMTNQMLTVQVIKVNILIKTKVKL